MSDVPRIGRILDLVGLLVFLAGGALTAWAWVGLAQLPENLPGSDGQPWTAMRAADGYSRLRLLGAGVMLAGIGVFVAAWWVARRITRAAEGPVGTP